ncbi:MAG: polyphosphate polymerase domain-containing protein [Clostridia bacterium]|nr:polyphosphate polymerase domain-containing protein [Clostridia bacterium]
MAFQTVFKRYEQKYMLSAGQMERVLTAMVSHMELDKYGRTTIRNLYYDTDSYLLIRRSIEKPVYKEKLRLRSYGRAEESSNVFVELKKKYKGVVYKRRLALPYDVATAWLSGKPLVVPPTQISREIDYFLSYYGGLRPTVFLSYERRAYYARDGSDFRITFDENVRCRQSGLSLCEEAGGIPLLPEGKVLMEIKCSGGIPLWLTHLLSAEKIYKTPFSKYGAAYKSLIYPKNSMEEITHV